MGNSNSSASKQDDLKQDPLKPKSISQLVDYIATKYIFTMNFESMQKLNETSYCDKLVILTSKILEQKLSPLEITYLSQRVKNGEEINEMKKDKVEFFMKDDINDLDVQSPLNKKRRCIGIAKFYIKIAHIFSAILMTINPVYVYKDASGEVKKGSLKERKQMQIPVNIESSLPQSDNTETLDSNTQLDFKDTSTPETSSNTLTTDNSSTPENKNIKILKFNICDNRIKALESRLNVDETTENVKTHPKGCLNIQADSLIDEPGITELAELYKDDNYDYKTGKFLGMSEETKKVYDADLKLFYIIFTGDNVSELPANIKSFSDIQLKSFGNNSICPLDKNVLAQLTKDSATKKLLMEYANNIKAMIKNVNKNQQELLQVINKLFVYYINPEGKREIRINPDVNDSNINTIILETRTIIMRLYLTCQQDYVNGIKIYEALVDGKIFETATNQIKNLNKLEEELSSS